MQADQLVGTWRLVSFETRDAEGRVEYPFGRDAAGFITYTNDGQMTVQFGRAVRPSLDTGDWMAASPAEIEAASRDYFAYCGTYELQDDRVVHHVALSLLPNLIGTDLVRVVALNGDTVTLSTPPVDWQGRQRTGTLAWQRI